jgi:hypothetical protein
MARRPISPARIKTRPKMLSRSAFTASREPELAVLTLARMEATVSVVCKRCVSLGTLFFFPRSSFSYFLREYTSTCNIPYRYIYYYNSRVKFEAKLNSFLGNLKYRIGLLGDLNNRYFDAFLYTSQY